MLHLHALRREVEVERCLELVGMGDDRGVLHCLEGFHRQGEVAERRAERVGAERRLAGDQVDQRLVRAVAVDDQDLLEAVVGDALRDVEAEGDERLRLDVDGAGEVDVV